MTAQDQKIIDKLAKLRAMAEGAEAIGNEAEATAFAEMFQRLLAKHKLDMSDIEFANLDKSEPVEHFRIDYTQYPDIRVRSTRIQWMELLAGMIARAYFCQVVVHPRSSRISLVGRKSDCQIAEYMIVTLQRFVDKTSAREAEAFKRKAKANGDRSQGNGFRSAWIHAFTTRLQQRLTDAIGAQTTGLVRIEKERVAVQDFIKDPKSGFTKSSALSTNFRNHKDGYARGIDAANRVDLGAKAMGSSASTAKQIRGRS